MIIKKDLISREIAGERFLVPVGRSVYDSNGLFVLTEVGAFIWDLLPRVETVDDIVTAIVGSYEVEEDTARRDTEVFLDKLRQMDIL